MTNRVATCSREELVEDFCEIIRALEEVTRLVGTGLDLTKQVASEWRPLKRDGFEARFHETGLDWTEQHARRAWTHWLLKGGFTDIADLIATTLEKTHRHAAWIEEVRRQATQVEPKMADVKASDFHRMTHTDKLKLLKGCHGLSFQGYRTAIDSIVVARNCLVHRLGVVAPRDITEDGALVLAWIGSDTTIRYSVPGSGEEVGGYGPGTTVVDLRMVARSKTFAVGDRVAISAEDFSEIVNTVVKFCEDSMHALLRRQRVLEQRGLLVDAPTAAPR